MKPMDFIIKKCRWGMTLLILLDPLGSSPSSRQNSENMVNEMGIQPELPSGNLT